MMHRWRRPLFLQTTLILGIALALPVSVCAQDRVLGIDVSAWQGNISQTTWNNIYNVEGREFVFIRSSRGGTTGFYNQSNPGNDNPPGQNTLSQRYDDPYFIQNITRAVSAGMLAGPYHFARPNIVESTLNSGGIANSGADEADHFIEMAGAFMRPGYLLPVFDLESGNPERTSNELAQFSIDFSDRIYETFGIRPTLYTGGNYSTYLQGASSALEDELVEKFPTLWNARYAYQSNPDSSEVQTAHPKDSFSGFYGPWDDPPNPTHPWSFWQYASTLRLDSYNNGGSNLDANVAQGGIEFVKDHLVPALWTGGATGEWTDLTNWNSGQDPIVPVQGPGQVPRIGPLTLPQARLPGTDDTVVLDDPDGDITVTLSSGLHSIRKLYVNEPLNITGATLGVNYVPAADSTPESARFMASVSVSQGSLAAHTLELAAGSQLSLSEASMWFEKVELARDATTPAKILVAGDVILTPWGDNQATIVDGQGAGAVGTIDLAGGLRDFDIADSSAAVDFRIEIPIVNGGLTKGGPGTLSIDSASTYAGDTAVEEGVLSLEQAYLHDNSSVLLSTAATLDLAHGGIDSVARLMIDGVQQLSGVWGAVGTGAQFTHSSITGTGVLVVSQAPVPGDANGDGSVDILDLDILSSNFGMTGGAIYNDADFNGDGSVDILDLDILSANFGSVTPAAVPEPASLIVAVLVGAAGIATTRTRASIG